MAELGQENYNQNVNQTELTSGHDVTQLLSHINQNFKQSKADQILRLLHDQDKLTGDEDECKLLQEYDQIQEEKVVCDSDTLTESSSDKETQITVKDDPNEIDSDSVERKRRSRTSMGFYNGAVRENSDIKNENDMWDMDMPVDTRERTNRPKSSYVRRPFRRREEPTQETADHAVDDSVNQSPQRPLTAKPRARYGSAAAKRVDRKIEMFESGEINSLSGEHLDIRIANDDGAVPFKNRFSIMRTAKRESKKAKKFCDDSSANQNNMEHMNVDSSIHSICAQDEVTEVQINTITRNNVTGSRVSSFANNVVSRNHYPQKGHNSPARQENTHVRQENIKVRQDNTPVRQDNMYVRQDSTLLRQDAHNTNMRQEIPTSSLRQHEAYNPPQRPDVAHNQHHSHMDTDIQAPPYGQETVIHNTTPIRSVDHVTNSHASVRRNDSASGYSRPKNPEPIQSRPVEARPSTRRRLTRRYMQTSQVQKSSSIRPTSESVLLARQRTEKNLIKKQADNRPQSEKIILNGANKILSVAENPAQGPQTSFLTSKGGVPQPAHVQNGGFRGYDPGSRLKSSSRSRGDIPGDMTLPRPGQANMMLGGRKPLTLMKLPPLEAMAAKSKKERGLALAARETCV